LSAGAFLAGVFRAGVFLALLLVDVDFLVVAMMRSLSFWGNVRSLTHANAA